MNWSQQTDTLLKTWSQAQQQMWNHWVAGAPMPAANLAALWRDLAAQGLKAWTSSADPTVKSVTEQLFNSQNAIIRFLELAAAFWTEIGPQVQNGGDWQTTLSQHMNTLRETLLQNAADSLKTGKNASELWQLYMQQWQIFGQPWANATQQVAPHWNAALTGSPSALNELTNLYWETWEQTFGRLLQSPGLGYTRELEEKIRRGFEAWLEFQQVSFEYQTLIIETWVRAFEQLLQQTAALTQQGEPLAGVRPLLNLWSSIADSVFKDVFRSEKYIQVQGRLINAAMAYRVKQREIMEVILTINDLPTRSELDEAHQLIYALRKEVKALKKQINQLAPPNNPPPEKPKSKRVSRKSAE